VWIEAESMVCLFNSSVQTLSESSKTDREQMLRLCTVSQQKGSFRSIFEQTFGRVTIDPSPIERRVNDVDHVGHEMMLKVDLTVDDGRHADRNRR
jgi:hypothetical protein